MIHLLILLFIPVLLLAGIGAWILWNLHKYGDWD